MIHIYNNNTDPFLNLAFEEYLLNIIREDCFMLWQDKPSVIVGKHQNTLAEINYQYARNNNVRIARRLSGGGAVYHDLGNLNFTFILLRNEKDRINYKNILQPLAEVLEGLVSNVEVNGRNDIMIDGKKVSGSAAHIRNEKILMHGTLLFSTDLDALKESLTPEGNYYSGQSVKSIKSSVANISEYLHSKIDINTFRNLLYSRFTGRTAGYDIYEIAGKEISVVNKLVNGKYGTWDWTYSYSPGYTFHRILNIDHKLIDIRFEVNGGKIFDVNISGDFFEKSDNLLLGKLLEGSRHEENSLMSIFESSFDNKYFPEMTTEKFVHELF